jgi:hypothetical protein
VKKEKWEACRLDRTLRDWAKFNVAKELIMILRLRQDDAIMAVNRKPYLEPKSANKSVSIKFKKTYS